MPAIKKERLDGEEMALAAFNQPEYLAPATVPVVTPHAAPYPQLFPHPRSYLPLPEHPSAHPLQQHLHQHLQQHLQQQAARGEEELLLLERFSSVPDFQPCLDSGEPCIEVECGDNKAVLYMNKLCQGSKGPSIKYRGEWLTPNEFQFVSGRETAKDWKRSIRHKGKSLKTLMSKGILQVHPPICDCPGCRISSPVNRGRLAEKRSIPLPATRTPKKELPSTFSSEDSEGSERAGPDHPEIKLEEDLLFSTMRKSESVLPTLAPSLQRLPQYPTAPDAQRRLTSDTGSGHTDHFYKKLKNPKNNSIEELLGKRRAYSPSSSSRCTSNSKKSRSQSPPESSHSPGPGGQYHRMMSALTEPGSYEEQQQRLYQLASGMGMSSHTDVLRVRTPGTGEGGSSSSQRRKQGLPQHRDAHFSESREMAQTTLLSPQSTPHITLGPHLRPPFLGMPSVLCQTPAVSYSFLQPAHAEMFARQQEMLRKQNLARLEMSAELLRQKELEGLQRPRLLADPLSLPPGLPPDHPALRSLQELPEGHPLRDMLVLRHGNPLLSLTHQGVPALTPHKGSRRGGKWARPVQDSESEGEVGEDGSSGVRREVAPPSEASERASAGCSSASMDSPSMHHFTQRASKSEAKYLSQVFLPPPLPPLHPLPFGFPYASPYLHAGAMGGLLLDGEDAGPAEDISKWSVDDVCSFIDGLAGCSEYAQVFREQAIDGETLPLLTEEHLLSTMGLKLGPALKIRSQVARRAGRILYMAGLPLAFPLPPSALQTVDREPTEPRPPSAHSTSPHRENGRAYTPGAS